MATEDLLFRLPSGRELTLPPEVRRLYRLHTMVQHMLAAQGYEVPMVYAEPDAYAFWCRYGHDKYTRKRMTLLARRDILVASEHEGNSDVDADMEAEGSESKDCMTQDGASEAEGADAEGLVPQGADAARPGAARPGAARPDVLGRDAVLVFFPNKPPQRADFDMYIEHCGYHGASRGIIVIPYNEKVSASAIQNMERADLELTAFYEATLLYNVAAHELVPRHTRLSEAAAHEVLTYYHAHKKDLTRLQRGDPQVRWHNYTHGDVVRLKRPDAATGMQVHYSAVL